MRNMEMQFAFCISFCWIFVVFPKYRLRFLLKISSSKSYSSFQLDKDPDLVSIKTFVFFQMFCVFCFALFVVCYYYSYCCLYVLSASILFYCLLFPKKFFQSLASSSVGKPTRDRAGHKLYISC